MALSATVAAVSARAPVASGLRAAWWLCDVALRSAASLVFSRSRAVGAALLAAVATEPRALAAALFAVAVSALTARALRLDPERVASGQLSYSALLLGLALSATAPPSATSAAILALAAASSVLVASALDLALRVERSLPVLTLPFLVTYYLALGALPAALPPPPPTDALAGILSDGALSAWLRGLGALLCAPRLEAGLLVLAAIALHSRIAAALSLLGFAAAWSLTRAVALDAEPSLAGTAGLNGALVAVALGGVWFIPSVWSYLLALFGSVVSVAVTLGLAPRFERLGLPLAIAPFNLVVPVALYALRQRVADGRPHAIDFAPGTPEQNLAYFRSRSERFGAVGGVRFGAPFRGVWTCTQGVDGGITHDGAWRHALDFEVLDDEGRAFRGTGATLDDFHCYKLPVVAPAAGVVAKVIDGVVDNAVGDVNVDENWGNVVIVYHAPGVYSCLAHLSPGTVTAREGQHVAAGEVLGRCGNSGRSATPHLHMQLQATATVGDATIPIELHDVVTVSAEGPRLHARRVPERGERVRRIDRDEDLSAALRFEYASVTRATTGTRDERIVADLDLLGRFVLRSQGSDAALYYESAASGFTVHDVTGDAGSALHLVRAAIPRVPFDADVALAWRDRLPLRPFMPVWQRPLFDLVSPFGGDASLVMTYRARRVGDALVVEGESERRSRDGAPWVTTSATLTARGGIARLTVNIRGRARTVTFDRAPTATQPLRRDARNTSSGGLHAQAQV